MHFPTRPHLQPPSNAANCLCLPLVPISACFCPTHLSRPVVPRKPSQTAPSSHGMPLLSFAECWILPCSSKLYSNWTPRGQGPEVFSLLALHPSTWARAGHGNVTRLKEWNICGSLWPLSHLLNKVDKHSSSVSLARSVFKFRHCTYQLCILQRFSSPSIKALISSLES